MCVSGREILCINDHIAELGEQETGRLIASLPSWRREGPSTSVTCRGGANVP